VPSNCPVIHCIIVIKKNIAIKQHFVRECVEKDYVELMCMSTEEMPADMLTKGLE
jgi:hypothetical protein